MKLWLTRTLTGFVPADDDSAAVAKRVKIGTTIPADITTRNARSTQWHRRYWLLCSMLAANVESVEIEPGCAMPIHSADDMHTALKFLTGLCDTYTVERGNVRTLLRVPRSTAFDRMDADEWAAHWNRVLDAVHQQILPGVEIVEVEQELARLAS